jgi:DNA primase
MTIPQSSGIFVNEIQALKEKANSNIHDILELLGVTYKDKQVYLAGLCPIHDGDNKNAWSWHVNRGVWQCYTAHCHDDHDCDIYGLIRAIKEMSFMQAKDWLKKTLNCSFSKKEMKELKDQQSNREFINQVKRLETVQKTYSPSILDGLVYHNHLEVRGYDREIIERYRAGIGRRKNQYMSDRIIFPIVNIEDEIVGFTGRTLLDDWEAKDIPKWKHSREFTASHNLFNINNAKDHIREAGEAIIVEGPLDVLRLEQAGIHNSVALLGKILHNRQMTLLMGVPTERLKFALDADAAGLSGAKKAVELARSFFGVEIIQLPKGKDCGDLTIDEARRIFNGCYAT